MIICVDFDGTIVDDSHAYDDLDTPLTFLPGAREALQALVAAGHVLMLWSARASRAGLEDPTRDPLVRAGVRSLNLARWAEQLPINRARYDQMVEFVERELSGVFAAIDDGHAGKPSADLFIDDKAIRLGVGAWAVGWNRIAAVYGEAPGDSGYSRDGDSP